MAPMPFLADGLDILDLEALHAAQRRREREANEMVMLKINKLTAAKAAARRIKEKSQGSRPGSRASSRQSSR